ncbi:hypothetical protein BDZ94DRAFT_1324806 [Collybia nuda]|uniref:Uncharacterized protein n=1 Tax=Collybia nuda TaxID=64659 RepID=A0A9P6CFV7_9AGAR|nr:hypothetical protein BDZ94DRAFT_1324806 [Collybia nuda]
MAATVQENDLIAIERVDSGATNESPFGSNLTTPVDEEIQLFQGIEQKLPVKPETNTFGTSESSICVGEQEFFAASAKLRPFSNAALESQEISEIILGDAALSDLGTFSSLPLVYIPSDGSTIADLLSEGGNGSRSPSIYSLPNLPINVGGALDVPEDKSPSDATTQPLIGGDEQEGNLSALPFADTDIASLNADTPSLDDVCFTSPEIDSLYTQLPRITRENLIPNIMRVVIFLPWCVAVGGVILLCPKYLDLVAFGPGYVETPRGIRRLAYWADSGMQHVGIFLAFLATIAWLLPMFGIILASGMVAQFVYAWYDFVVDPNVPLGADDRQTMYIVATQFGLSGNTNFSKKENNYFLSWLEKEDVIVSDSEEE